jgi:NADPH-dependent curcumin reductase CurA
VLRERGRIAVCGMISRYNDTEPAPGPRNLFMFVSKRLRMQGFLVRDHGHLQSAFREEVGGMLADGRLIAHQTVVEGIENVPSAFVGLLRGLNVGKMVVRLG